MTTKVSIGLGGTSANSATNALISIGAASNAAYTQANNAYSAANSSGKVHPFLLVGI